MRVLRHLLLLSLVVGTPHALHADQNGETGDIILEIKELQHTRGTIRCGLYTKSSWLKPKKAVRWVDAVYDDEDEGRAVCAFTDIGPGVYGIGTFHDADDDHDMDSNFIGIPTEGVCASNDPEGRMGPPKFENAKFRHRRSTTRVPCSMNY